jgi:hypothetical protein
MTTDPIYLMMAVTAVISWVVGMIFIIYMEYLERRDKK